jgi:nicotinamidase-related amidase
MQEAFRPVMPGFDAMSQRLARLAAGARLLNIPILVTEQYPKGLGHTVNEVRASLSPEQKIVEKTSFSSCGEPAFVEQLVASSARQVILCGVEAHVCVNQTAHDLIARGLQVHLVLDCILSRSPEDREAGILRMRQAGVVVSTMEMVLFELMRDAKHPQFKAVQKLLK